MKWEINNKYFNYSSSPHHHDKTNLKVSETVVLIQSEEFIIPNLSFSSEFAHLKKKVGPKETHPEKQRQKGRKQKTQTHGEKKMPFM